MILLENNSTEHMFCKMLSGKSINGYFFSEKIMLLSEKAYLPPKEKRIDEMRREKER